MTCTITLNTVREIREQIEKVSTTPESVAIERWVTDGGSIGNETDLEAHKPLFTEQKSRDYAWYQSGSIRKNPQAATLKQYHPSSNDISRHNPHV